MLRFYVIATAIVVGALLVALRFERPGRPLEVAPVRSTGSPSAARPQGRSTLVPLDVNGNAPWALSALPECFEQVFSARGKADYLRAQLPGGAVPVTGRAELLSADCRLEIAPGVASVERRGERLVIPPPVQFYRWPARIGFVRMAEKGGGELRVYRLHGGGPIVLAPGRNGP